MKSRSSSSIKNFSVALIGQIIGIVISFIARLFFIRILGKEYLGLNGLFTNILTVLSLTELGVGTAITYSLYKPLAEKDINKCKMLMQLYKKIYIVIGFVILIIGVSITPLLPYLIKDMPDIKNINLIYFLFVLNTSVSYFFSYKRNLIIADQNRYIATVYRYGFYALLNISQIIYLLIRKDYIGFLVLQVITTLLENICISIQANKMYPYLKDKDKIQLEEKTKKEIIKNTKAMMMHKIGGVVVTSTDNILLSSFVSISSVGIYSNYYLIINALNLVFGQVYNSLSASIGNLCAVSKKDKQYDIFKKINFLTFWIYSFAAVCLLVLFNSFIEIWLGNEYLFSIDVVCILVINFYITGMRRTSITFKEATGLFEKDKYKAIFEAIINLAASIILAKYFGVFGVFLGTFISSIATCLWVEPYVLFKYGFERRVSEYFKDYAKKSLLTLVLTIVTFYICNLFSGNLYLVFILKCFVCLIVPNLILFLIYHNTDEFRYFYDKLFVNVLNRFKNKIFKAQ